MAELNMAPGATGAPVDLNLLQESRQATVIAFARWLRQASVRAEVKERPEAFARAVRLAVQDYGVKQTLLSQDLDVSSAAVSRWMHALSLPPAYARDKILDAMADIIEAAVKRQGAADGPLVGGTI